MLDLYNNIFSKVVSDGKSATELFQELSQDALVKLVDYYKDDFAIGGYDQSMDVLKWLLFRRSIKWW